MIQRFALHRRRQAWAGSAVWVAMCLGCGAAQAQVQPVPADAGMAAFGRPAAAMPGSAIGTPAAAPGLQSQPITVIEVHDTVVLGLPPQRAHHALSIRSEAPQRMLRSMGFDAAECATRFRMPSKLRQNAPGGGSTVVVQAQIGLACSF